MDVKKMDVKKMDVKNQAPSSRSSGIMKTKARLLGMQAYSWRQYKVGCA